jgi:predicted outer membrane protein
MLGASTGFAQETKDTLKTGETTHDMVIKPEPPKDSMVVNPGRAGDNMVVLSDTGFISKNITDNMHEIQLSKVGLNKGTGAVKKVATQMISDHTGMLNALTKMAAKKGLRLPQSKTAMSSVHTPGVEMKAGKDFNASWATQMLNMHAAKIMELENFLPVTQDAELKTLIGLALPKMRAHRDMLEKIPGAEVTKTPGAKII